MHAGCNLARLLDSANFLPVVEAEADMSAGPPSSRRRFLRALAASALPMWPRLASAQASTPITRTIPATGEVLPAIGVGSWITFNVPPDTPAATALVPVLRTF